MIPNAFSAQGAAAACILIAEGAAKRRRLPGPPTLTPREHAQCEALRTVIKCYQGRLCPSSATIAAAKAAAATVKIQL